MQFKKIFILLPFTFFLVFANQVFAQEIKNNYKGERIIVYKDGSWRYFNENDPKDQALWETQMNVKNQPTSNKEKKANLSKQSSFSKKKTKQKEAKEDFSFSTSSMSRQDAIRFAEKISREENKAIKAEEDASLDLFFLEEDLDALIHQKHYSKTKAQALRNKIKEAEKLEKNTRNIRKKITKKAEIAGKMIDMLPQQRAKTYAKLQKEKTGTKVKAPKQTRIVKTKKPKSNKKDTRLAKAKKPKSKKKKATKKRKKLDTLASAKKNKKQKPKLSKKEKRIAKLAKKKNKKSRKNKNLAVNIKKSNKKKRDMQTTPFSKTVSYAPPRDVMRNPPPSSCNIAYEGVDEFTGKKRRDVRPEVLFTHTSERLKPFLKEKDFISCKAGLTQIYGHHRFISFEFVIASLSAQREFGMLEKGAQIIIYLIDGTTIESKNVRTDTGTIDSYNKTVTYNGQCLLSTEQAKAMNKMEVDKIRIVWSTGFEDYDIYNMDFFKDQLNCLNSE